MAIPVLMYHAVLPIDAAEKVRGTVPLATFREGWLARRDHRALTLDEVADALAGASDATLARVARIHGEYHDVAPEDPRTRIDAFANFLRARGCAVEVVPHPRKPNLGLFFAARPELAR